ncbi:MAG: DUF427 domain-containing protein [Pseudomonadota bacterium]
MAKAIFHDTVIAESADVVTVEGNAYFPPSAIRWEYFSKTAHTTLCPWKGTASYYSVAAGGESAENIAWAYEEPREAAANIKGHVAFYPSVKIEP